MLQRTYRLSGTIRISPIFSQRSQDFIMKIGRNSLQVSRFGFTISKKVEKSAVKRNALKRKLRSCIEKLLEQIPAGYDILFIIRSHELTNQCDQIKTALQKAKLL